MSCCKKKCGQSPSPPPKATCLKSNLKSVVVCIVVFKTAKKFKTDGQSADVYLDNVKLHACFQKFIYL